MPDFRDSDQGELSEAAKHSGEFDWRRVELDEELATDAGLNAPGVDGETRLQEVLRMIFDFTLEPLDGRAGPVEKKLELVARRLVALGWVMNPSRFGDDPSATQVANSIGCHKAVLSELTAEVSRIFGLRNRHQLHGANFKAHGVTPCNKTEEQK